MEDTNAALLKAPAARRNGDRAHEQTPSVGRMIGKYRIVRKLGAGGMGDVYLAEDTALDRKVAIKVINLPSTEPSARRDALERFKLEAQAIARISHPNVVTVHEFSEIEGEYLLVMEYLPGRTLRELIEGERALPPDQVVCHANAILSGLDAIHRAGLIHRDLKPQNILLLTDGRLKILDLGLVKFTECKLDLTRFGVAMGSPLYMAPEQIMTMTTVGAIDKRVDIYALGVVLYQLLTGKPPYRGATPQEIMQQHVSSPIPTPVSPLGHVSPVLTAIVVKAMSKQADDRYQSAGEMRAELEHVHRARRKSTGPQQPVFTTAAATVSALATSKPPIHQDRPPGFDLQEPAAAPRASARQAAQRAAADPRQGGSEGAFVQSRDAPDRSGDRRCGASHGRRRLDAAPASGRARRVRRERHFGRNAGVASRGITRAFLEGRASGGCRLHGGRRMRSLRGG